MTFASPGHNVPDWRKRTRMVDLLGGVVIGAGLTAFVIALFASFSRTPVFDLAGFKQEYSHSQDVLALAWPYQEPDDELMTNMPDPFEWPKTEEGETR